MFVLFAPEEQHPLPVLWLSKSSLEKFDHNGFQSSGSKHAGRLQSKCVTVFRFQWTFNYVVMFDLWNNNVTSYRSVYQTHKHQSRPVRLLKGCKQTKGEKWARPPHVFFFVVVCLYFTFFPPLFTKITILVHRKGTAVFLFVEVTEKTDPVENLSHPKLYLSGWYRCCAVPCYFVCLRTSCNDSGDRLFHPATFHPAPPSGNICPFCPILWFMTTYFQNEWHCHQS